MDFPGAFIEKEYLIPDDPDDNASIMKDNLLTGLIVSDSAPLMNNNQRLNSLAKYLLNDCLDLDDYLD